MKTFKSNFIPSNLIDWELPSKVGTTEMSILEHNGCNFCASDPIIEVESTTTLKIQKFHFNHIDWADPSHEDVAGWNYTTMIDGQIWTLLIIND